MAGVDVDQVVARLQRARHRLAVPAAQVVDVRAAHPPGLDGIVPRDGEVARAHGRLARVEVGRHHAAVHQLDAGERAVLVHLLDQPRVGGDVGVLPDAALDVGRMLGRVVELDLLGAHHRPAALGLGPAHRGVAAGVKPAHAVAVRHLEEPVAGGDRPDLDGLEEDVEAGFAHGGLLTDSSVSRASVSARVGRWNCRSASRGCSRSCRSRVTCWTWAAAAGG